MSGHTADKLAYMANQIARNMALDVDPVAAMAEHITAFWTRRMIDMLLAEGGKGLDPIAAQAMARVAQAHVSDAG